MSEPGQEPPLKYQCASCFHYRVAELGDLCRRCKLWDRTASTLVIVTVLALWGAVVYEQAWSLRVVLQMLGLTLDILGVFVLWKGLVERFLGSLVSGRSDLLVFSGPKHMRLRVFGIVMIAVGFTFQRIAGIVEI